MLLLALAPRSAAAAEIVRGNAVTVPAGATFGEDLYLFGGTVQFLGTARRDVVAAAGVLNIVGPVEGSLTVAAGRAEVRGTIGRGVRVVGASVAIYGGVAGDVVVAGGTVTLVEGAAVAGDVVVTGGRVTVVDGAFVGGEIRGSAREVIVEGRVGGDVDLSVNRLHLTPAARVDGDVRYRSEDPALIDAGAAVAGTVVRSDPAPLFPFGGPLIWAGAALPRLIALLAAGAVVLLLLPRRAVAVADGARAMPLTALLVGTGLLVLVPIVALLFLITVVATPIAVIVVAGYVSALYLSQVLVGLAIGRVILRLAGDQTRRVANLLAMAIGVILLWALRRVPVPYADIVGAAAIAVVGLGALAVGFRHDAPRRRRAAPAGRDANGGIGVRRQGTGRDLVSSGSTDG